VVNANSINYALTCGNVKGRVGSQVSTWTTQRRRVVGKGGSSGAHP